jgi:lipopolysaccharide heptosyltransferase II
MPPESRDRASDAWSEARSILCVRLDSLGDVLMTSPALRALRGLPRRPRLTVLTSESGAGAAMLLDSVDEVIRFEAPWMKTARVTGGAATEAFAAELRGRGFDGAVIFTVYSQSALPAALLCHFAEIPLRLAHCRENPYHLLSDWVPDVEPAAGIRHEVRRQLELVATIGARSDDERMSIRVPSAARRRARSMLAACGISNGRPWAVVHPGASASSRRYNAAGFAEAARILVHEHRIDVVFTGDRSEVALIAAIRAAMDAPSHSLAGRLELPELAALIELAPILISNNTGPVHLAAAVGTPVVDLYALTNPQHTPWAVPNRVLSHDVSCKYCYKSVCPEQHHRCLDAIPPRSIVTAACELLEETR